MSKKTLITALTDSFEGSRFICRQVSSQNGKTYRVLGFYGLQTIHAEVIYEDGQIKRYTLDSLIKDTPTIRKSP